MSAVSINSVTSYGRQVYGTCSTIYDRTRATCKQIANEALNQTCESGARFGYQIGNAKLIKTMLSFRYGVPAEKILFNDLQLAILFGTVADVKSAIEKVRNSKAKNSTLTTALHLSVVGSRANSQICNLLLAEGADIHAKGEFVMTPLHGAMSGNLECVIALLKAGANIEAKDDSGATPLHYAARAGNAQIVNFLLESGANIEAKNNDGNTPLLSAISKLQKESIRALVGHGGDIYARNSIGIRPLEAAAGTRRMDILSILNQAESHPAFASEGNLHAYFEKMFPSHRLTPRLRI